MIKGIRFTLTAPERSRTFKTNHPTYLNPYRASVYGADIIYIQQFQKGTECDASYIRPEGE